MTDYTIRVQLLEGDEEDMHLGTAKVHDFTLPVTADTDAAALEAAHDAIPAWGMAHGINRFHYVLNFADRMTGPTYTVAELFEELGQPQLRD